MSVRRRLIFVFAALSALLLLPAAWAALRLEELSELAVDDRARHANATLALGRFQAGLGDLEEHMRRHVAAPDLAAVEPADAALDSLRYELAQIGEYGFTLSTDSLGVAVDSLAAITEWLKEVARTEGVTQDEFQALEIQAERTQALLTWVGERIEARSRDDFERARAISASASWATWVAVAVAVLFAVGAGFWASFTLSRPLRRLRDGMAAVAEGAFEAPTDLPYDREDEIGDLSRRFQWMTQRLAELDRMKAEFAGVATHELKNPIHVIQGYVELLREGLVGREPTAEEAKVLGSVKEQITLLTRLVDRLLQISRMEAGAYPIHPTPSDPSELLSSVGRTFDVLAARQEVAITMHVDEDTPPSVRLDADLIRNEVLGNLVSNALKYTPQGGDIRLGCWGESDGGNGRVADGSTLVLEVSDSGPGIPPEKAAYVFEKYYQAGEKDRDIGSGLGLAIARETVEAHGGTIELADVEGRGATFRIRLPVGGPPRGREEPAETGA